MNAQLLNPFARDTPERIESSLENAFASCLAFNGRRSLFAGQYLAVGRSDHYVAIYDLETRTILRWFLGHVKSITSVSWSPHNRYVLSASLDASVNIWDLRDGPAQCIRTLRFSAPVVHAQFSPVTSRALVVVLSNREAFLVRFPTWDELQAQGVMSTEPRRILLHDAAVITTACFTHDGRFLLVGTAQGYVMVFDAHNGCRMHNEAWRIGTSLICEMAVDEHARHLVVSMNDRTIRTLSISYENEAGPPTSLLPTHKFQDLVGRTPWSGIGFSPNAEYVMGGAAQDTTHHVYIWDRDAGVLVKILEGPREPLLFAHWHPTRPQVASIASSGDVYLWSTKPNEIWSAYAPGFEELERNVEYEERENEFDLVEDDEDTRKRQEDADTIDLFANGPIPESSLPIVGTAIDLKRTHSTLAAELRAHLTWTPELVADDDDQVAFFIPPLLEDHIQEEDVDE